MSSRRTSHARLSHVGGVSVQTDFLAACCVDDLLWKLVYQRRLSLARWCMLVTWKRRFSFRCSLSHVGGVLVFACALLQKPPTKDKSEYAVKRRKCSTCELHIRNVGKTAGYLVLQFAGCLEGFGRTTPLAPFNMGGQSRSVDAELDVFPFFPRTASSKVRLPVKRPFCTCRVRSARTARSCNTHTEGTPHFRAS